MNWLSWLPSVFITQQELDALRKEVDEWKESHRLAYEGCMTLADERDQARRERDDQKTEADKWATEYVRSQHKFASMELHCAEAVLQRDEANADLNTTRCQLSALRQKHSVLIHLVNDAAMNANELDEATNCGVIPNGAPVGEAHE